MAKTRLQRSVEATDPYPSWRQIALSAAGAFVLALSVSYFAETDRLPSRVSETGQDSRVTSFVPPARHGASRMAVRVVGVTDGDTLTVLTDEDQQVRVRLLEIDAPEQGQPWGARAKEALSRLTFGKDVEIQTTGVDQYGRVLGRIYLSGVDVNAEMIRSGNAWAYRDYLTDTALLGVEAEARFARRGLWSLPANETVPPWSWRHGSQPARSFPAAATKRSGAIISNTQCMGKQYCRQMASCTEARFYMTACHVSSLVATATVFPAKTSAATEARLSQTRMRSRIAMAVSAGASCGTLCPILGMTRRS